MNDACVLPPKEALLLAGYNNRELLARYVAVEDRIGHTFQHRKPLVQIQNALTAGQLPGRVDGTLWNQCAWRAASLHRKRHQALRLGIPNSQRHRHIA